MERITNEDNCVVTRDRLGEGLENKSIVNLEIIPSEIEFCKNRSVSLSLSFVLFSSFVGCPE